MISYKSANEYHFPLGKIEILCPVSSVVSNKMWSHFPNSFTETTDNKSTLFSNFIPSAKCQSEGEKEDGIDQNSRLSLSLSPFLLCIYYNSSCSHHCRRRRPLVVAPPPPPPLIFLGRHVSQISQIGCSNFLFSIFNLYSGQGSYSVSQSSLEK